jgi:predicted ATPase
MAAPIVGRADELGRALALVDDEAPAARAVVLGGEAGIGKTTLVRAFAERVDCPVLQGSCESLATPSPFGPFADIAATTGGALTGLLEGSADPRTVALALLDELARSTLVVLEDVHWADEATLDALRVLGRRIDQTRGMVIATFRATTRSAATIRCASSWASSRPRGACHD